MELRENSTERGQGFRVFPRSLSIHPIDPSSQLLDRNAPENSCFHLFKISAVPAVPKFYHQSSHMDLRQESEQKLPRQRLAAPSQSKAAILVFKCISPGFSSPAIPTRLLPADSATAFCSTCRSSLSLSAALARLGSGLGTYVSIRVPRCKHNHRLPFADYLLTLN